MKLRLLFKDGRKEEHIIEWAFTSNKNRFLHYGTSGQEIGRGTTLEIKDLTAWDVQQIVKGGSDGLKL